MYLMRKRSWTEKQLRDAAKKCFSYRQVLIQLNLREAGGNYEKIKKYLSEYKIDTSHFKGRGWNAGLAGRHLPRTSLKDLLIKGSRVQSFKLKQRLFREGLKKKKCEECSWAKYTADGYLPLELDHINGDRHDNRLENLRVLCPNCHSLKPTHRGRVGKNKKKKARVAE
jgi:Zn finger protein HypA/HybF involved in hydrogenase expression